MKRFIKQYRGQFFVISCLLIMLIHGASARDLGVQGAVFVIEESSLLEQIKQQLTQWKKSNQLTQKIDELVDMVRYRLAHLPRVVGITPAVEKKVRFVDPTMIIQRPIMGADGAVLAVPGQAFNPLAYITLAHTYVFLDLEREAEWQWLLARDKQDLGKSMVIVVGGDVLSKSNALGQMVYYDQGGVLSQRFQIAHTPSIVTQYQDKLQIEEVRV